MRPGTPIGTNVRLDRMISEGGMGSIWVADHLTLGTQVAVKFIASELVENSAMLARFQLEATSAAQIKSPHVVQVFDHGVTEEGQPYIVMELLHGEDLDTRIERLGKLSLAETALVVRHACKALSAAHKLRLVHRDIKPANLFVIDADGEPFVKVLDFGIAKKRTDAEDVTGLTNTGSMVGTPHFMSPEQVTSSRHVDAGADLWAVAVVAYNCLLGRRPFEGETMGALAIAIHAGRFLAPTQVDPTLPQALDGWFERALARDSAARFSSAKELSEAFAACIPADARSLRPEPISAAGRTRISSAPTLAEGGSDSAAARSAPQTLGGAAVKTDPGKSRSRALAGAALALTLVGGVTAWLAMSRGVTDAPAAASGTISVSAEPATPAPAATVTTATAASTTAATPTASITPAPIATTTATATTTSTSVGMATALRAAPRASHAPAPSAAPVVPPPPAAKDRGF